MPKFSFWASLIACIVVNFTACADEAKQPMSKEEIHAYLESKKALLHPVSGKVALPGGLVTLNLPQDFGYINPGEAEILLHDVWGNPPANKKTLGLIVPVPLDLESAKGWAILLDYSDDGHVKDDDARQINYDELLQQMKEAVETANEKRRAEGYGAVHLIGWAEKPYYDEAAHKLYWAKEFAADDAQDRFLNYDIRALGRQGVLVMSVMSGMDQLPLIQANRDKILSFVTFNDTQRYGDFNASTDKVAAYGMAALIAGGLAAKAGLFKGLLVGLIAFKKFLILGVIAMVAFVKKLFGRGKNS